jgi:hypothetical protein
MTLPIVTQILVTLNRQFANKQLQATSQKQMLFSDFKGSSASHNMLLSLCCFSLLLLHLHWKTNIKTVASSLSML